MPFRKQAFLAGLISVCAACMPLAVHANAVSTLEFLADAPQSDLHQQVTQRLQSEELYQAMVAMGVEPLEVEQRVAALSQDELAQLNAKLDELPAGSGVVEVVGLVFIVLMILELVGVTNIFTAF
ncbi:MAG: hypothetical protein EVA65_13010 [Oceanococcus sp.]|nr:MAG: hypothetical protein EVA65_13010 [Oceanococcus sp.]